MYYIYPKLSEKDGILFRLGGAGLGNILFTYARAVIYVQNHEDAEMIWPTWFSFKLGPILRHEPGSNKSCVFLCVDKNIWNYWNICGYDIV